MVIETSSDPGTLVLLVQDGAQPAADKSIHQHVSARMGMLEVVKPTVQRRFRSAMIQPNCLHACA
ncbi:MAG: hypothetical protein ACREO5_02105 [Candidatus Binatia bacterium]